MAQFKDIKGQPVAIKYLKGNLFSGRIASSYLFQGPSGVGKALTARAFIMSLVCQTGKDEPCLECSSCRKALQGNHPDIMWIKPEKNKNIKIEEVRNLKEKLSLKPYEAKVSVCVIEDAHMMTSSAANALLKVMEEPPGEALLILITNKKELLLETVLSRSSVVRFNRLSVSDTKNILLNEDPGISEKDAYFLAYFSQGSPGMALEFATERIRDRKDVLLELVNELTEEANLACMGWDTESKDVILEDIEMLVMFLRDICLAKEGLTGSVLEKDLLDSKMYDFFKNYSTEKIYEIVERLIKMKRALAGNVNPKLVAQVLPVQFK